MKVAVVGQGYVGLSLSEIARKHCHEVFGIEIDSSKYLQLQNLEYKVYKDFEIISECDIVVIAVQTPLDKNRNPDLSYLLEACSRLRPFLKKNTLVINESTSYPGTLREIIVPNLPSDCYFAVAPERVDPGNTTWHASNTTRVIGGIDYESAIRARDFYSTFTEKVMLVSSPEVAEASKLFENTFRQVNIALANEFALIANRLNFSVAEAIDAAATKPFGFLSFFPSIGVGGHCIPIDPLYLHHKSSLHGYDPILIRCADDINRNMLDFIFSKIDSKIGVQGKLIQISGIAYKKNVSDVRESPAILLMNKLRSHGAKVIWHDEFVKTFNDEFSVPILPVDIGIICSDHDFVDYSNWKSNETIVCNINLESKNKFTNCLQVF